MAQMMPLPLTASCFSKIQIGCTFLVLAHPGSPGQKAVKRGCVYVCFSTDSQGPHDWNSLANEVEHICNVCACLFMTIPKGGTLAIVG